MTSADGRSKQPDVKSEEAPRPAPSGTLRCHGNAVGANFCCFPANRSNFEVSVALLKEARGLLR